MPLVMSKDEWSRIVNWTDTGRENPETVRKKEYIRYLHETSRAMTKSWPNSLENVNKRNEELRRARIEIAEQANTNFYKMYVKRKRDEQQRLLHDARDIFFKNKDAPKMLLGAVIETVTQKEREEQIKFLTEIRRQAAERKDQDDAEIMRKAREWNELMETRKQRRFEANKKYQMEILEQAKEVADRNMKEYEMELSLQKQDNVKANEQIATIKKFEKDFKAAEKARIFKDIERARQEAEAARAEQVAREHMDDRLMDVLRRSRARVDNKRKSTEKEIQEEKLRVLHAISLKLESGDAAREEREQEILNKAINERALKSEARRQAGLKRQEQLKEERKEIHRQFLREEAQRLHELQTTRCWDLMNRFKNVEIYEDFVEKQREEKKRKTEEYKQELLRLWKERDEREARELADKRYFYGEYAEQMKRADEQRTLAHGAALLEEARQHARPEHALHRAIDRYCKQQRLYPMPALARPVQLHFPEYAPQDRSGREARLALLTAPADDALPPLDKRDGLEVKAKHSERPQEATDQSYKRKGPANGMQRKSSEEVALPPVSPARRELREDGK